MRSGRPWATALAAVAVALILAVELGAGVPAGAVHRADPPLPEPRVKDLTARTKALTPRIIDLTPKVELGLVTVTSDVLFAFDQADLLPGSEAVLDRVVTQVQQAKPGAVTITGYTDSVGDADYNLDLSRRRAESVRGHLASKVNRPDISYAVDGKGEDDPVAPNDTASGDDNPAGRRLNRRVTIQLPA